MKAFNFELLNGKEIAAMTVPEQDFLIKDLLVSQSVNMFAGEEGCGKSLLAMNLAIAIAANMPRWLSHDISKHGKVLYLNNELPLHC